MYVCMYVCDMEASSTLQSDTPLSVTHKHTHSLSTLSSLSLLKKEQSREKVRECDRQ